MCRPHRRCETNCHRNGAKPEDVAFGNNSTRRYSATVTDPNAQDRATKSRKMAQERSSVAEGASRIGS